MNQRRRSGDERSAAQALSESERSQGGKPPTESGIAPRGREHANEEDDTASDSLYDRLVRSGALDEVMEVAAREQQAEVPPDGAEAPQSEAARGPDSAVVPKAAQVAAEQALLDIDVDFESDDEPHTSVRDDDPTPVRLPNQRTPQLPSVMLEPDAAPRKDTTDRVVLRGAAAPRARPSLTPQAARPGASGAAQPRPEGRPLLILVALLFLTAGALLFWFMTRPAAAPGAETSGPETAPADVRSEPARTSAEAPEAAEVSEQTQPVPPPPPEPAVEEAAPPAPEASEKRASRQGPARPSRRRAAPRRAPSPAAPPTQAASAEPEVAEAESGLPEQPSRDQVIKVMQALTPALRECAGAGHGDMRLRMTVQGSGRVSHAVVRGDFEGTPEGSCMARAARQARFPEFDSRMLRLTYPVRL